MLSGCYTRDFPGNFPGNSWVSRRGRSELMKMRRRLAQMKPRQRLRHMKLRRRLAQEFPGNFPGISQELLFKTIGKP